MSNSSPGSGFDVSPELIVAAAGTFEAQADALYQALQALDSRLATDGSCWGNDTEGAKFGAGYQPAAQQMQSDLTDLVTGLERVAGALRAAAAGYTAADQASSSSTSAAAAGSGTSSIAPPTLP